MLKDILNLPFFLLSSFIAYCGFFINPSLSHAFMGIALSALYGLQLHINFRTPKQKEELSEEVRVLHSEMKELQLERENLKIKLDINRMNNQVASNEDSKINIAF